MPHFDLNLVPLWRTETKAQHKFNFLLSTDPKQRKLELDRAYSEFVVQAVRGLEATNFSYDEINRCWLVTTNINFSGKRLELVIAGTVKTGIFGKYYYSPVFSEDRTLRYEKQSESMDEVYFFPDAAENLTKAAAFRLGHRKDFSGELVSNTQFSAFIGFLPQIKKQINDYFQSVQPKLSIALREELINQLSNLASDAMDMPLIQNIIKTPNLNLKPEKNQLIYLENGVIHWRRTLHIAQVNYEAENRLIQNKDHPIASVTIDSALPGALTKEAIIDCTIELKCYAVEFYNTPVVQNSNFQPLSLSELIKEISVCQDKFEKQIVHKKRSFQITEESMQATLAKAKLQQLQGIGAPRIKILRDENDINVEQTFIEETSTFIACGQGIRDYQEDRSNSHLIEVNTKSKNFNIGQSLYNAVRNLGVACSSFEQGSTLISSLIYQNKIYTASVGDSSAFLIYQAEQGWQTCRLNVLHKPTLFDEKQRIESVGGFVEGDRLNSKLALSRVLGDKHIFPGVCYEPDISSIELNPNAEAYLLLCSDGMTDALNEQDMTDIFSNVTNLFAENIADLIREKVYQYGSNDNTTVIVTPLAKSMKAKELADNQAILTFVADGHGLYRADEEILENETSNYIKNHLAEELKKEIVEPTITLESLKLHEKLWSELNFNIEKLVYLINSPDKMKFFIRRIQEKITAYISGGLSNTEAQPYLEYLAVIFNNVKQYSEFANYIFRERLKRSNSLYPLQRFSNLLKCKLENYLVIDHFGVNLTSQQRKILVDFTLAELAAAACNPCDNLNHPTAVSIVKSVLEIEPLSEWEKLLHAYAKINQLTSLNLSKIHNYTIRYIQELHDIVLAMNDDYSKEELLNLLSVYQKTLMSNLLSTERNEFLFTEMVKFPPDSIRFFWKKAKCGFSNEIISRLDDLQIDSTLTQLIDSNLNEQLEKGNANPKNLIHGYLIAYEKWKKEESTLPIPYQTAKFLLQLNFCESAIIDTYLNAYIKYKNAIFENAKVSDIRNCYQGLKASADIIIHKYDSFLNLLTLMLCLDEKAINLFEQIAIELTDININSLKSNLKQKLELKNMKVGSNADINPEWVKALQTFVDNFIQLSLNISTEFEPRHYIKLLEEKNINTEHYQRLLLSVILDYKDADIQSFKQEDLRLKKQLILVDLPEPNNLYEQFKLKFSDHKKWSELYNLYFSNYKNLYLILKGEEFGENLDTDNDDLSKLQKTINEHKNKLIELMELPLELLEVKLSENKAKIIKKKKDDIFGEYQSILKESLGLTEINISVKEYLGDLSFPFNDTKNPLYLLRKYYYSKEVEQANKNKQLAFVLSLLENAVKNTNELLQKTCYLAMLSILSTFDLTVVDNFKKAYLYCLDVEIFIFNQLNNEEDRLSLKLKGLQEKLEANFNNFKINHQTFKYEAIRKFYKNTYIQREFYFNLFPKLKKIKSGLENKEQLGKSLVVFNETFGDWKRLFDHSLFPEFKLHYLISQMAVNFLQVSYELIFMLYAGQENHEDLKEILDKFKTLVAHIYPWLKNDKQKTLFWRKLINVISNNDFLDKKISPPLLALVVSTTLSAEKFFEPLNVKPNFTLIKRKLLSNNEIFLALLNEFNKVKFKLRVKPNNEHLLLKAKYTCMQYIKLELFAREFECPTSDFSAFSTVLNDLFSILNENQWMIDSELLHLLVNANNLYVTLIKNNSYENVNHTFDMNYLLRILDLLNCKLSQSLDSSVDRKAYEKSFFEIAISIFKVIIAEKDKKGKESDEGNEAAILDLLSSEHAQQMLMLKLFTLLNNLQESSLKEELKNNLIQLMNIDSLKHDAQIEKNDRFNLELFQFIDFFEDNNRAKGKMDENSEGINQKFKGLQNFISYGSFEKDNIAHLAVYYKAKKTFDSLSDLYKDNNIKVEFLNYFDKKNKFDKNLLQKIKKGKVKLIQAFEIIPTEDKKLLYQAINVSLKTYKGRKQVKALIEQLNSESLNFSRLPITQQQTLMKFNSLLVNSSLSSRELHVPNNKKSNDYLIEKILDKINLSDKSKLCLAKYHSDLLDKLEYKKLCRDPDNIVEALLIRPALLSTILHKEKIQAKDLFRKFRQTHWEKLILNGSYPLVKAIITNPLLKTEFDKANVNNQAISSLIKFICKLFPDANDEVPVWSLPVDDMSILSFSTIVRWGLEEKDETIKRLMVNEPYLIEKLLTLITQPKATLFMGQEAVQLNAVYLLKTILGCQFKTSNNNETPLATALAKTILANDLLKNLCKQEPIKSILFDMHIAENLTVKYLDQDINLVANKNDLTRLKLIADPTLDKIAAKGKEKEDEKENEKEDKNNSQSSLKEKQHQLTAFFKKAKAGEIRKPVHLLEIDLSMAKHQLETISRQIAQFA